MVSFKKHLYLRGPDLKKQMQYRLNLSGTEINIMLPDNNLVYAEQVGELSQNVNIYASDYTRWDKENLNLSEGYLRLILKLWRLRGIPILQGDGVLADARFDVQVINMPRFSSLFRPRRLECAIERFLYSAPRFMGFNLIRFREQWEVVTLGESEWIRFENILDPLVKDTRKIFSSFWFLPISDQHFFHVSIGLEVYRNTEVVREYFSDLEKLIMNDLDVTFSSDLIRQKTSLKAAYPHEQLSSFVPPYEYEVMQVLSEWEIADKVSADLNHEFELGGKKFGDLCDKAEKEQAMRIQEVRDRVLKSHLRFEDLERQDYERYINAASGGRSSSG